nr:hypothetical protein [uncultured Anaerosporobacter sp.]
MVNKSSTIMHKLIKLLIISTFLDAYAIIYVGTYPVTVFTLVAVLVITVGIYRSIAMKKLLINVSGGIAILMMIYVFLNFIMNGANNWTSLLLCEFFFCIIIFSYRQVTKEEFDEYIKVFQLGMNILAVYGIYQLVARMYSLPLSDIVIDNHMVTGFNWTNSTYIAGIYAQRSNAIFREPSFFSQYLAINILLYTVQLIKNRRSMKYVAIIVINAIAMILSFSGTGFIILIFGGIIYLIVIKKDNKTVYRIAKFGIPILVVFIVILNTQIGTYFINRLSEVFVYTANNVSGYVRFRSGTDVLKAAWSTNFLYGIGIGVSDEFITSISNYYQGMTINGFYRPAVELGLIGFVIWLGFIISFWKKRNEASNIQMLLCILFPFMICHETFMSNYYWILLYLLNVKIKRKD